MKPKEPPIPEFNPNKYISVIRVLEGLLITLTIAEIILLSHFLYNFRYMRESASLLTITIYSIIYCLQMFGLIALRKHLKIRNEIHSEVDPEERMKLSMMFSKDATQAMKSVAAHDLSNRKKSECKIFKKAYSDQCTED